MMAKRIAQFHKVSFEQFAEGFQDTFGEMKEGELKEIYQSIKLPKRATAGSAGYDFYTPIPIVCDHNRCQLFFFYNLISELHDQLCRLWIQCCCVFIKDQKFNRCHSGH